MARKKIEEVVETTVVGSVEETTEDYSNYMVSDEDMVSTVVEEEVSINDETSVEISTDEEVLIDETEETSEESIEQVPNEEIVQEDETVSEEGGDEDVIVDESENEVEEEETEDEEEISEKSEETPVKAQKHKGESKKLKRFSAKFHSSEATRITLSKGLSVVPYCHINISINDNICMLDEELNRLLSIKLIKFVRSLSKAIEFESVPMKKQNNNVLLFQIPTITKLNVIVGGIRNMLFKILKSDEFFGEELPKKDLFRIRLKNLMLIESDLSDNDSYISGFNLVGSKTRMLDYIRPKMLRCNLNSDLLDLSSIIDDVKNINSGKLLSSRINVYSQEKVKETEDGKSSIWFSYGTYLYVSEFNVFSLYNKKDEKDIRVRKGTVKLKIFNHKDEERGFSYPVGITVYIYENPSQEIQVNNGVTSKELFFGGLPGNVQEEFEDDFAIENDCSLMDSDVISMIIES